MNYSPQDLLKKAEKYRNDVTDSRYAHNCPKRTGWLTPISQEFIDEYGWYIQEMVWSEESRPNKPCYSLDNEDWYKDGELMLENPFDYFN